MISKEYCVHISFQNYNDYANYSFLYLTHSWRKKMDLYISQVILLVSPIWYYRLNNPLQSPVYTDGNMLYASIRMTWFYATTWLSSISCQQYDISFLYLGSEICSVLERPPTESNTLEYKWSPDVFWKW